MALVSALDDVYCRGRGPAPKDLPYIGPWRKDEDDTRDDDDEDDDEDDDDEDDDIDDDDLFVTTQEKPSPFKMTTEPVTLLEK